jgi:uncharacterized protein DUF6285
MRDAPDTSVLLRLAAEVGACSDATEDERRLADRCRAIAAREQLYGTAVYGALHAALARLYGWQDAASLLRRLAGEIRAGRFDAPGPERTSIERLLLEFAAQRLRENNPDF